MFSLNLSTCQAFANIGGDISLHVWPPVKLLHVLIHLVGSWIWGKGPDWMFDLELLTPSMNYIPVRKENYADSGGKVSTYDDVEDLDDQQFIVHGPNIHAAQNKHSEERTADKEANSFSSQTDSQAKGQTQENVKIGTASGQTSRFLGRKSES
ncbi:hypothetical protein Tco_0230593 [Tanacetum coccineum]